MARNIDRLQYLEQQHRYQLQAENLAYNQNENHIKILQSKIRRWDLLFIFFLILYVEIKCLLTPTTISYTVKLEVLRATKNIYEPWIQTDTRTDQNISMRNLTS